MTHDKTRWIVQGDDVRSGAFANVAQGDPGIDVIETIASDVVLVSMPDAIAERIKRDFSGRLIVERDRFLTPP